MKLSFWTCGVSLTRLTMFWYVCMFFVLRSATDMALALLWRLTSVLLVNHEERNQYVFFLESKTKINHMRYQ